MALATWWEGDMLPKLAPLSQCEIGATQNMKLLVSATGLEPREVSKRLKGEHRPYIVFLKQCPVGYGWVATREASIGECNIVFSLPPGERYLWDFVTLSEWRGLGIYPYLLQTILHQEKATADRFWILHAPENRASASGIRKAGFQSVDEVSFTPELVSSYALTSSSRAKIGAVLLGIPWTRNAPEAGLTPCWHCSIRSQQQKLCPCYPLNKNSQEACTC